MSRNLAPPYFADPPAEYNRSYFAQLTRAFATFVEQQRTPGEGRNTKLVLTDLQQSDAGLEAGTLYLDGNTVKVAMINMASPTPASATSASGVVTVLTP